MYTVACMEMTHNVSVGDEDLVMRMSNTVIQISTVVFQKRWWPNLQFRKIASFVLKVPRNSLHLTKYKSTHVSSIFWMYSSFPPYTQKCVFTCTKQQAPDKPSACHSRIVGPQYGACFMSAFRCVKFASGSWLFGKKYVDPWSGY
jgi:hypothetical protein